MRFTVFITNVSNGSIIELRSYVGDEETMEPHQDVELVCQHSEFNTSAEEDMIVRAVKDIYRSAKEAERANDKPAEAAKDMGGSDNGTLAAHGKIVVHI